MVNEPNQKAARDNRANQRNPNNSEYNGGRTANDNRANQRNPNNPKYKGGKGKQG